MTFSSTAPAHLYATGVAVYPALYGITFCYGVKDKGSNKDPNKHDKKTTRQKIDDDRSDDQENKQISKQTNNFMN